MIVLVAFAFIAGAATAVSPCVLPVLPVALSAGATGGRRRPLGVVTGLVCTFTFATVALVYVIDALGLPDNLLRVLAIAVLATFGVTLLVPRLAARVEAGLSRLGPRRPASAGGDGFGSGLLLGGSLGLVYAPCAGPILAGVITVSASQDFTAGRLAVAFAYALGSAVALYVLMLGGRRLTFRLSPHSGRFQAAAGAVMVCVAVLMAFELDIRFESSIATSLPAVLINPSGNLEKSSAARGRLADLRGGRGGADLPVLAPAPDIQGTQKWFNTAGGRPLSLASLRGRVVLIDFWTYSCVNCLRTLPYLTAWDARYRAKGLTIVGVHSPEFPFERDAGNVARAVRALGIRYPVAQDNDFVTWNAYGNRYWPAKYLIDARGRVRVTHFGEGGYAETEAAIRSLLAEAGHSDLPSRARARTETPLEGSTPETYLGAKRSSNVANGPLREGERTFRLAREVPVNTVGLEGRWRISADSATAVSRGARLHLGFAARRVFLVLGSDAGTRTVNVSVDGRRQSTVRVSTHRLYDIVTLPAPGAHLLTLEMEPGVEAYAFTFG
jgi:cytochrome c biogenesis protein CcdA/thiol-disulfide isomerase/thioredoxin